MSFPTLSFELVQKIRPILKHTRQLLTALAGLLERLEQSLTHIQMDSMQTDRANPSPQCPTLTIDISQTARIQCWLEVGEGAAQAIDFPKRTSVKLLLILSGVARVTEDGRVENLILADLLGSSHVPSRVYELRKALSAGKEDRTGWGLVRLDDGGYALHGTEVVLRVHGPVNQESSFYFAWLNRLNRHFGQELASQIISLFNQRTEHRFRCLN